MSEQPVEGGAGPALATHSKDAGTPGPTPASQATGDRHGTAPSDWSDQARDTADRVMSSASRAAGQARDYLSDLDRAATRAADFTREQPWIALLSAGLVGAVLGILLARR